MDSFASLPTPTTNTSYYSNPPNTTSSQQLFDLQFASEVSTTNNEQFHQMLQHHQALVLQQQQQQQQQPQQVMYDHRRDSTSSSGGTNRRVQSKAEKRAEHNAIERARREGLNTRFQQLAHLLPNLQHDTRPSKGTIIERTLEFVKDAIQKEDRYRHEIKDLRHTNRQLLKQLTHLTTGQDANSEAMDDSDDQISIRSPSPSVYALPNSSPPMPTTSLPATQGSSTSSLSSGASSPPPPPPPATTSTSRQPSTQQLHKPQKSVTMDQINSNQQIHSARATSRKLHQAQQQQQVHRRHRQTTAVENNINQSPPPPSSSSSSSSSAIKHTPSLSSFSSEVWHQPTNNTFWSPQTAVLSHPSASLSFAPSQATTSSTSSIPNFTNAGLFTNTTTTTATTEQPPSSLPPSHHHHYSQPLYIHAASEEDVDMKACDFSGAMIKEDQAYSHPQHPGLFLSQHQHTIMPLDYSQGPSHRLSSRPVTAASFQSHLVPQFR